MTVTNPVNSLTPSRDPAFRKGHGMGRTTPLTVAGAPSRQAFPGSPSVVPVWCIYGRVSPTERGHGGSQAGPVTAQEHLTRTEHMLCAGPVTGVTVLVLTAAL